MKTCTKCGLSQPLTEFNTTGPKRYSSNTCKSCQSKHRTDWTNKNWRNYFSRLVKSDRHKQVTADDCISIYEKQNGLCAITGIPLTRVAGQGRVYTNASMDRIETGGPYTVDNVRLVCYIVNVMRNDMQDNELLWWSKQITKGLEETQ